MPECVFQCRHPVWNSRGNCSANVCSCGPGFVSNDSLGNPSCVPETALVGIFASVGTLAGLALVIVLWKAWKVREAHRQLGGSLKVNRKTRLLARLMVTTRYDTQRNASVQRRLY